MKTFHKKLLPQIAQILRYAKYTPILIGVKISVPSLSKYLWETNNSNRSLGQHNKVFSIIDFVSRMNYHKLQN